MNRHPALALATLVVVGFATMHGIGCRSIPDTVRAEGTSAGERLRPVFEPGEDFVPNPQLAEKLGVAAVWDATGDMAGDRVLLSQTQKNGSVSPNLQAYAREVEHIITSTYPDRIPIPLRPDLSAVGFQRLREAGVSWTSVAFTRDAAIDPSVSGVICDNAGIIMDFGDSYWTLSWNATRGKLGATQATMSRFMDSLSMAPVAMQSR